MTSPDRSGYDRAIRAAKFLAEWAEEARGHYGIEECGGPGKPATEWDAIQDGLAEAAADVREAVAALGSSPETPEEKYRGLAGRLGDEQRCELCGGPAGIGGHHGMLDHSRTLRIPRHRLPAGLEEIAVLLGFGWFLDREYGELLEAAA